MSFKQYQSKPITRTAHQLGANQVVKEISDFIYSVEIDGEDVQFHASEQPVVGDFVIHNGGSDIYHCPRYVFLERNVIEEVSMTKTLHNSDVSGARKNVADIKVVGDGDTFALVCKASSKNEGWMKSTKAMQVPNGCMIQVTTQQQNPDGSYSVAEALAFVPGVKVEKQAEGGARIVSL